MPQHSEIIPEVKFAFDFSVSSDNAYIVDVQRSRDCLHANCDFTFRQIDVVWLSGFGILEPSFSPIVSLFRPSICRIEDYILPALKESLSIDLDVSYAFHSALSLSVAENDVVQSVFGHVDLPLNPLAGNIR